MTFVFLGMEIPSLKLKLFGRIKDRGKLAGDHGRLVFGYDELYFRGLTSEKLVTRFKKGRMTTMWVLKDEKYKRNEPLDLRNYATAALEIANPVLTKQEAAIWPIH